MSGLDPATDPAFAPAFVRLAQSYELRRPIPLRQYDDCGHVFAAACRYHAAIAVVL